MKQNHPGKLRITITCDRLAAGGGKAKCVSWICDRYAPSDPEWFDRYIVPALVAMKGEIGSEVALDHKDVAVEVVPA